MTSLRGEYISLRAIEPSDLAFLYQIENDESNWSVSNTQKPFSKFLLQQYLDNAHLDIYEAKQLRLVIFENKTQTSVGMIDLFDFDPKHLRVGLGVLIVPHSENKGYASEALKLLINYSFTHLDAHQIFANISEENTKSISLFEKQGFKQIGVKKDWLHIKGQFKNELFYQLINE